MMTIEVARREAVLFETLTMEQLFQPIVGGDGALGEVGCSYLAQSVAEHDRAFHEVVARMLERRDG